MPRKTKVRMVKIDYRFPESILEESGQFYESLRAITPFVNTWTNLRFPVIRFVQCLIKGTIQKKVKKAADLHREIGVLVKFVSPAYPIGWVPPNAIGMEAIPSKDFVKLEAPDLDPEPENYLSLPYKVDSVNHPNHYGGEHDVYETIKVAEAKLTSEEFIGAMKFNVMKYNDRARHKGVELENYEKAQFYQNRLVEHVRTRDVD